MRDLVNRKSYRLRKSLDDFLFWVMPNVWVPLYNSVSFSHMPYKKCIENRKWQDKVRVKLLSALCKCQSWQPMSLESKQCKILPNLRTIYALRVYWLPWGLRWLGLCKESEWCVFSDAQKHTFRLQLPLPVFKWRLRAQSCTHVHRLLLTPCTSIRFASSHSHSQRLHLKFFRFYPESLEERQFSPPFPPLCYLPTSSLNSKFRHSFPGVSPPNRGTFLTIFAMLQSIKHANIWTPQIKLHFQSTVSTSWATECLWINKWYSELMRSLTVGFWQTSVGLTSAYFLFHIERVSDFAQQWLASESI